MVKRPSISRSAAAGSSRRPPRNILLLPGWYDYEMHRGIAQYAQRAQWVLYYSVSRTGGMSVPPVPVAGVLTLLPLDPEPELLRFIRRLAVPVVDMADERREVAIPRVVPDNRAVGRLAAEHLIEQGLVHLAYCQYSQARVEQARMAGFSEAARAAGRTFHPLCIPPSMQGKYTPGRYLRWLMRALLALPKPVGVMGQYDVNAAEIARACLAAGLRVPEEVAVIGADNDDILTQSGPIPLTSVDTNRRLLGYEAAALLDRLMAGRRPRTTPLRIAPKEVVVRHSTDITVAEDPRVERAMRFIRQNLHRRIAVSEVCVAARAGHTRLCALFKRYVGRSIRQEILRQRIRKSKEWLERSDEKSFSIAKRTGFSSREHFCQTFRRIEGMPPMVYRRQSQYAASEKV